MINIGIIGPGRVAERHAAAIKQSSEAQLWSVCGTSFEKTGEFAVRHEAKASGNVFTDIPQMLLDPNLDAVVIATPDHAHVEPVLLATRARKAVLIEKPVSTSVQSCQEILLAQQAHKNSIAVAYHLRWHAGLRKITQLIHANQLGNIHHMRLHWAVNFAEHAKWRINRDSVTWCCLSALGTHLIDFIRWSLMPVCGEIVEIKSILKNIKQSQSDGTVLLMTRFSSGTTVELFCSVLFDSPLTLEIYAEKENVVGHHLNEAFENRTIMVGSKKLAVENSSPYVSQINNFVQTVLGKQSPEVSLAEGIENVKLLNSISGQR